MKNPNFLSASLMLLLFSSFSFGQVNPNAAMTKKVYQPAQAVPPQQNPSPNKFVEAFDNISNAMNVCTIGALKENKTSRDRILSSNGNVADQLTNYMVVKSLIAMDNRLLDCATAIMDSLSNVQLKPATPEEVTGAPNHDTVYVTQPGPIDNQSVVQGDCTQKIIYISAVSGLLLLTLLLLLIKFIRSQKIFKKLYDKLYDKLIDELADKILVGVGVKEDDKLKEKIKKLVALNQSRKKGELKLDEYLYKVDVVLE